MNPYQHFISSPVVINGVQFWGFFEGVVFENVISCERNIYKGQVLHNKRPKLINFHFPFSRRVVIFRVGVAHEFPRERRPPTSGQIRFPERIDGRQWPPKPSLAITQIMDVFTGETPVNNARNGAPFMSAASYIGCDLRRPGGRNSLTPSVAQDAQTTAHDEDNRPRASRSGACSSRWFFRDPSSWKLDSTNLFLLGSSHRQTEGPFEERRQRIADVAGSLRKGNATQGKKYGSDAQPFVEPGDDAINRFWMWLFEEFLCLISTNRQVEYRFGFFSPVNNRPYR